MVKTLLPIFLVWAAAGSDAVPPEPRTRSFHMEYRVTLKDIPAGAKSLDLWIPVPQDDAYQAVSDRQIEIAQPFDVVTSPDGNRMIHVRIAKPDLKPLTFALSFHAVRQEHLQSRLSGGPRLAQDESPAALAKYLKPDRLVPLDDQIRAWAREVVTKAGAHTDLEMARAIYNHVVSTVKYDKTGKGWGRGDIYYACEERRGNCTDFHAIFIGYARALGIPARFAIGFPLPVGHSEGQIAGYHCWAEFYAKGIGWVPVDASEAAKNPDRREYFFGAHDENRIEFSKGRDLELTPRQQGQPLNFFVYPYTEIDGRPHEGTELVVTFRDEEAPPAQRKTLNG
jgi:transglutaminase-like putative cysteine protease